MTAPNLSLTASSSVELLARLAATDITVPLVTEGRTSRHREQYVMARFLATRAKQNELRFPLSLVHDDQPDFVLTEDSSVVAIECIEAVPEEWYEIEALRERFYPDEMNFGQIYRPGQRVFTMQQLHDIASGKQAGPPWAGSMP